MKGDIRKLFVFLTSKNSENHRRPRSVSVASPKDAIYQGTNFPLNNGDSSLYKDAHFPNNTVPRRRKSQHVTNDRGLLASKAPSGHRYNFGPVFRKPSVALERKRIDCDINLDRLVMMNDFMNEDMRKVWSSLKDRSVFSETSIQDGYLTTVLCSTELWL